MVNELLSHCPHRLRRPAPPAEQKGYRIMIPKLSQLLNRFRLLSRCYAGGPSQAFAGDQGVANDDRALDRQDVRFLKTHG
jgi:hypothetical protein